MTLAPGAHVGPYEIVGPVGAGGMGEVYRARDPRIRRDVAIKILPAAVASNPDRLRRFEQEVRAIGALNHPNLLVIFDAGSHEGTPFLVSELLEGETLRDRMSAGPLPPRKALDYAVQIANGLAAAHEKAIVHRDLKPENIFITSDDRVKLLDFGLAKVVDPQSSATEAPTARLQTDPGVVVGTAGYMSPEQVRGGEVDHRSDVFSFGVVLHEMITGAQPFRRDSVVETMNAILHDDPPPVTDASIPPALPRLVEHALDKQPSRRFESMKDVAFAIAALSSSGETSAVKTRKTKSKPEPKPPTVTYERVTFRRGYVMTARFAPDGSIVYGASWEDRPLQVYTSYAASPEARPHGIEGADLLSVSRTELAISLGCRYVSGWMRAGTLARRPLAGGAPRPLAESVECADFGPDGKSLLLVRSSGGMHRIECPIGTVIHESAYWLSHARWSPRGDRVAFVEHSQWGDDGGWVVVIDREGHEICRSSAEWYSTGGIAWTPKGDQVWVAANGPAGWSLQSLGVNGRERTVLASPVRVSLHDIRDNGRVLIAFENARREIAVGQPGHAQERNLGWFDWSWLADVTEDGKLVLIIEQADAAHGRNVAYLRPTDGGDALHIGDAHGRGYPFTPDGKWMVLENAEPRRLELVPVGAGEPRPIAQPRVEKVHAWQPFPDLQRLLILGGNRSEPVRLYEMAMNGDGSVRAISQSPAGWPFKLSPDGGTIVALGPDEYPHLFDIAGGESRRAPGCTSADVAIGWTADGRGIHVHNRGRTNIVIERVDIATGERTKIHTITPSDLAGILDIGPVRITSDGRTYVYGFRRFLSDLFVVSGLA